MDCLFSDKEAKEILIYAEELRHKKIDPMIYAAPDWDTTDSARIAMYPKPPPTYHENGISGYYYGMPVYTFDGIDSHMCFVLPDNNTFKPF